MTNQIRNQKSETAAGDTRTQSRTYDLKERTAIFGEGVITFVQGLEKNDVNRPLINQVVRSATSIGANYLEADSAASKKDFRHKIALCKKEAAETMHWLRMIAKANPARSDDCRRLWKETHELTLIFAAIIRSKGNDKLSHSDI